MPILPIVTYNDPILRQKTTPIEDLTPEIQSFINDMFETMYNSDGVGLAAPQVGSNHSIFVMDADPMADEDEETFGNGFYKSGDYRKKGEKIPMDEGCLSIPQVTDKVSRPEKVLVKYRDGEFNEQNREFDGWVARVIQHEFDHLEGVLFIDYLSAFRRRMHKKDLKEIDSGNRETSYPVKPK